jgi:GTPase
VGVQITQMKYRLSEGSGECFYYVGVEDGGYPRGLEENDLRLSLNNLNYMASSLKATAIIARLFLGAHRRFCALVQVRRNCVEDVNYVELRVAGAR